jgi:hypothetical protein
MAGSWTNDAVTQITVPTGAVTGSRIVIGSQPNGNAISFYDAGNNLISEITNIGDLIVFDIPSGGSIQYGALSIIFTGISSDVADIDYVQSTGVASSQAKLRINNTPHLGGDPGLFAILGGSADGSKRPTATMNERGVAGSLVQSDQVSTNNLVHIAAYSGTTDAGGHAVLNHGASFTPAGGLAFGSAPGTFGNLTGGINSGGFTATQFDTSWKIANTGAAYAASPITFYAMLFK